MPSPARCSFAVAASDLPAQSSLREGSDADWRCHRRAEVGDRCAFHADPGDRECSDADLGRRLVAAVRGDVDPTSFPDLHDPRAIQRAAKRLLGARMGHLDLSRERLASEDTYALDLRGANVGVVDLTDAELEVTVDLSGATVGELDATDCRCDRAVVGVDLTVAGAATFDGCHVAGGVDLTRATVEGPLAFDDATVVRSLTLDAATPASLSARALDGRCRLHGTEMRVVGDLDLTDAELDGVRYAGTAETTLRGSRVGGDVRLAGVSLSGNVLLNELRVAGDLDLRDASVGGHLWAGSRDDAIAELGPVQVGRDLLCSDCRVAGNFDLDASDGDLDGPLLGGVADLSGVVVGGALEIAPRFEHPRLRVVDLSGATVPGGRLGQPPSGDVCYRLDEATVGDVDVEAGAFPAADHVRFLETTFEGFQFTRRHRTFDRVGWRIHDVGGDVADLAFAARYREARLLAHDVLVALRSFEGAAERVADLDESADLDAVQRAWFPVDPVRRWVGAGKEPFKLVAPPPIVDQERDRHGFTRSLARDTPGRPLDVVVADETALATIRALAAAVVDHDATSGSVRSDGGAPVSAGLVDRITAILDDQSAVRPVYEGLTVGLPDGDPRRTVEAAARLGQEVTRTRSLPTVVPAAYESLVADLTDRLASLLARDDDPTPTPAQRETTYLLAKQGAKAVGDTGTAAGEFYIHEKHARRAFHWESAWAGTSPLPNGRALYDWTSNVLLGLTSGYGERPRRVVVFSMAVVALFAGVFALLLPRPPYHPQFGYVLVSLESFITLVLGGAAAIEAPQVRLVAQVEGFLGAFLIALFVFTLTRSIDR